MVSEAKQLALELGDDGFAFFVIEGDIPTECLAEFDCPKCDHAHRVAELVAKTDFATLAGADCEIWLTGSQLIRRKAKLPEGTAEEKRIAAASALSASTAFRSGSLVFDVGQRDLDGYTPLAAIPTERLNEAQALARTMKMNPIRVTCSDDIEGFSVRPTFRAEPVAARANGSAGMAAGLALAVFLPILVYFGFGQGQNAATGPPISAAVATVKSFGDSTVNLPELTRDALDARLEVDEAGAEASRSFPRLTASQSTGFPIDPRVRSFPIEVRTNHLPLPIVPSNFGVKGLKNTDPPPTDLSPPRMDLRSRVDSLPYWHHPPLPEVAKLQIGAITRMQATATSGTVLRDGRRMFRPPWRPGDIRAASPTAPRLNFNANRLAQPQAPEVTDTVSPTAPVALADARPGWISPSMLLPMAIPAGHGQDDVGHTERREAAVLRAAQNAGEPNARLVRPFVRRMTVLPSVRIGALAMILAPDKPAMPKADRSPVLAAITDPGQVVAFPNSRDTAFLAPTIDALPKRNFPIRIVARRANNLLAGQSGQADTNGGDSKRVTARRLLIRDKRLDSANERVARLIPPARPVTTSSVSPAALASQERETQVGSGLVRVPSEGLNDQAISSTADTLAVQADAVIAEGYTDLGTLGKDDAQVEPVALARLLRRSPPVRPTPRSLARQRPPDRAGFLRRSGGASLNTAIAAAVAEAAAEWEEDDKRREADPTTELAALSAEARENITPVRIARSVPPLRPNSGISLGTNTDAANTLGDGVRYLSPLARPSDLRKRAEALRAARAAAAAKIAARQVPIKTTPDERLKIPSSARVGSAATIEDGIPLGDVALVGIFGKKQGRRALIRLPQGRILKVERGASVNGWTVSSVDEDGVRLQKGSRNQVLRLSN